MWRRLGIVLVALSGAGVLLGGARPVAALTTTPTGTPTPSPRPERTGDLGIKDVVGVVYDASEGRYSLIGGATVFYNNCARFPPGDSGTAVADEEGRFSFSLFLHDTDYVTIRAEAPGFLPARVTYDGLDLGHAHELEIGLAPASGEIAVEPREMTVTCEGAFGITVTSTGEEPLRITQLSLQHGYSQGWYGTGFSWDTSHIELPVSLPGGASLVIPVSYSASGQDFPSRLHLTIDSSAHNEPELFLTYFGESEDCATPTATPMATSTPAPCAGDCDRDGRVNIHELVRGVAILLGHAAMESCPALDTEGGGFLTVNELVRAVDRALQGCHGALPDLIPTGVAFLRCELDGCSRDPSGVPRQLIAICVANRGDGDAGPFLVQRDSEDPMSVAGLRAGGEVCLEAPYASGGTVVVDVADEVEESNEVNNILSFTMPASTACDVPVPTCTPTPAQEPTRTATPGALASCKQCCADCDWPSEDCYDACWFTQPCELFYSAAGSVFDSVTGLPIASATVAVGGLPTVITDGSGHYSTSGSRPEICNPFDYYFSVSVTAPGYLPYSVSGYSTLVYSPFVPVGDIALDPIPAGTAVLSGSALGGPAPT